MAQRRDRGRRGRYNKGKPQGKPHVKPQARPQGRPQGKAHRQEDRGPRRHPHKRPETTPPKREMIAKGKAADLGLDGKLRIEMEPLSVDVAARLSRGKGALVYTPRGDRLGQVDAIVGTVDSPIAVVRVFPDMRKEASEVQGRELFMG